ncbi:hypothetical protein P154DRAFT_24847 [Amniculicola lignicola CBS 123094]|uniref:Uncharacterized protein n=1 Tax=Amniculicola lignicola CBS 123094 TaxID=1392246 RepID=A0A6A5WT44_9PLEO|nr:hypothetical protein P154DRAFT_24847 [Amniculicola lignicola CBS 123094]
MTLVRHRPGLPLTPRWKPDKATTGAKTCLKFCQILGRRMREWPVYGIHHTVATIDLKMDGQLRKLSEPVWNRATLKDPLPTFVPSIWRLWHGRIQTWLPCVISGFNMTCSGNMHIGPVTFLLLQFPAMARYRQPILEFKLLWGRNVSNPRSH